MSKPDSEFPGARAGSASNVLAKTLFASPVVLLICGIIFFCISQDELAGWPITILFYVGEISALAGVFSAVGLLAEKSGFKLNLYSYGVVLCVVLEIFGLWALSFHGAMFHGIASDAAILIILTCLAVSFFGGLAIAISRKSYGWVIVPLISAVLLWYGILLSFSMAMGRMH